MVNCTRAGDEGHEPSQCGMCSPPGSHLTLAVVPSSVKVLCSTAGFGLPVHLHELHWHVDVCGGYSQLAAVVAAS